MADNDVRIEKSARDDEFMFVRKSYPRATIDVDAYEESSEYGFDADRKNAEFHIRECWRKVRKHKWLIVTIVLLATTLTTIEMYRRKSVYRATTLIEIGKEEYAGLNPADRSFQDPEQTASSGNLKTKIYIIKSDPLLEDVVVKLGLDHNPVYRDSAKRSVTEAFSALLGHLSDAKENRSLSPATEAGDEDGGGPATDKKTARDASVRLEPYVASLRNRLEVENIKDTQLLSIGFSHTDPEIAEAVANSVAQAFIDRSFDSKTEKFTRSSEWLERTTRELQAKMEQAERALADYARDHNLFSLEGKETLTSGKLASLHDQTLRAQVDRMLKESLYEEVKAGRITQLPESFADAKINELQKKQNELAMQAAQLSVTYGPLNPRVAEVKEQINTLQQQIDRGVNGLAEKLKADYERALRDEQSLSVALERAKSEASQQNQYAIQFGVLKQNVETTKSLYTNFLQRASQAKVQVVEQHNNVRVIQPAKLPGSPVGPNRMGIILASLALSLMGSVGIALIIEYLDRSIKTVEDVVRQTQLPTLGVIPAMPRQLAVRARQKLTGTVEQSGALMAAGGADMQRMAALNPRSSAAEAYRGLRTSILLSAAENPPKTVLVTSGRSGEGKTTTVVNTAISLAQLGASVLIIDCDLRKPSVHKALKISSVRGLSTYLSRDLDVDSFVVRSQFKNLSVLPCGLIPPNPAELISSPKMKKLLRELSHRFDHILIDSPPILQVTDPVVLSTMVDGVILVVHSGKSTRDGVRRSCQELTSVGAKNYGIVLNNINLRREGYGENYYTRYYYEQGAKVEEFEA